MNAALSSALVTEKCHHQYKGAQWLPLLHYRPQSHQSRIVLCHWRTSYRSSWNIEKWNICKLSQTHLKPEGCRQGWVREGGTIYLTTILNSHLIYRNFCIIIYIAQRTVLINNHIMSSRFLTHAVVQNFILKNTRSGALRTLLRYSVSAYRILLERLSITVNSDGKRQR